MRILRRLNRRSFMARVAGTSMFGSVAILARANAQNATGRTDSDSGANADRAGYGRTGATDSDSGAGADRAGYGRGGTGPRPTGITDSDQGAGADRAGYGRGTAGRSAGTRPTGITDSDQGAGADRAGYGRGTAGRGAGTRPTGVTDSDQGATADRAGNGRGTIRREQTPDLPVAQPVTAQDVETVRRAFTALTRGDPAVALGVLDPRVRWQAVAGRALADRVALDRRGADFYVRQMAGSIASGERRLELISVAADGDRVVVESEWVKPGETASRCTTVFMMVGGIVAVVVEVPFGLGIPPDIVR
jgi:ketosteroid isomerase-like protein